METFKVTGECKYTCDMSIVTHVTNRSFITSMLGRAIAFFVPIGLAGALSVVSLLGLICSSKTNAGYEVDGSKDESQSYFNKRVLILAVLAWIAFAVGVAMVAVDSGTISIVFTIFTVLLGVAFLWLTYTSWDIFKSRATSETFEVWRRPKKNNAIQPAGSADSTSRFSDISAGDRRLTRMHVPINIQSEPEEPELFTSFVHTQETSFMDKSEAADMEDFDELLFTLANTQPTDGLELRRLGIEDTHL